MRKKKSYNPFKMWGSYVGASVSFIVYLIVNDFFTFTTDRIITPTIKFPFVLYPIILGFLVGWGIHSSIRRLRK